MMKVLFKNIVGIALLSLVMTGCLSDDDSAVIIPPLQGEVMAPEVGGPTEPNQVWIDLESGEQTITKRTDWDLAFYSGEDFRVVLNYSTLMAAAGTEVTEIDEAGPLSFLEYIQKLSAPSGWSPQYMDNIDGDYTNGGTAIAKISAEEQENKVYLLKLGYKVFTGTVAPYTTNPIGTSRGFKKIRILRHGPDAYLLQYADTDAETHKEFIIEKDPAYNYTFFSFDTEETAMVQPPKNQWDMCYTTFNNVIEDFGTYTFSDFVVSNIVGGTGAYEIVTQAHTLEEDFNSFSLADVEENRFIYNDRRVPGDSWRSTVSGTVSTPVVFGDRFYVLKNPNGKVFKLRFLSLMNDENMRGYPKFEFSPL